MELQSCINYLLTVTQHAVSQKFADGLAPFGIIPSQYGVLYCLWTQKSCTPKEIAQALRLESSTISGVLDRMQKCGLVDRVVDPNDRRSVRVIATEKGESLKDGALQVIDRLNNEVLAKLSAEEQDTLLSCLRKIADMDEPVDL